MKLGKKGILLGISLALGMAGMSAEAGLVKDAKEKAVNKKAQKIMETAVAEKPDIMRVMAEVEGFNAKFEHKNYGSVVDLKILVDDEYIKFHRKRWQSDIEDTIGVVDRRFREEFGIGFRIGEVQFFDSVDAPSTAYHILEQAKIDASPGEMDAVVVLTGAATCGMADGLANKLKGNYALVTIGGNEAWLTIHEISHLFGAVDLPMGDQTIMSYRNNTGALVWTAENEGIIRGNISRGWDYYTPSSVLENRRAFERIGDPLERKVTKTAYMLGLAFKTSTNLKGPKLRAVSEDVEKEFLKLALEKYPGNGYLNFYYALNLDARKDSEEMRGYLLEAYESPWIQEDRGDLLSIMYKLKKIGKDPEIVEEIREKLGLQER